MDSYLKVGSYNRFYGLRMKYFFLLEGGACVLQILCYNFSADYEALRGLVFLVDTANCRVFGESLLIF